MNTTAFGLHIGNTNASLAVSKEDGYAEIVVNESGDRTTPSIVAFTEEEIIVGLGAKSAIISNPRKTFSYSKSQLKISAKVNEKCDTDKTNTDKEPHFSISNCDEVKHISPQIIVTQILRKLYDIAKDFLNINENYIGCVLLVPQYFSDDLCDEYKTAAETVGWKVLQVIHESAAAILACSILNSKEQSQTLLVYRLGGKTCETVAYDLCDGMLFPLDSEQSEDIGGNVLTDILADYLANEFYKKYKLDPRENKRSTEKLKQAAEKCVHILSKTQTANYFIESLQDGVDMAATVSRARFELLIQPVLPRFGIPILTLLNRLNIDRQIVEKVLLYGGATNVPKLQSHITNLFEPSVTTVITHPGPGEVLALGAAKQAHQLLNNQVTEFLPRSTLITVSDKNEDHVAISSGECS